MSRSPSIDRRAAHAEEILDHSELLDRVALPDHAAIVHSQAVEHSFRAVDVHAVPVHDRGTSRTAVIAVHVDKVGRILDVHNSVPSSACRQTSRARSCDTFEVKVPSAAHRSGRIAAAAFALPDDARSCAGHVGQNTCLRRAAIAIRPEETRPILALRSCPQIGRQVLLVRGAQTGPRWSGWIREHSLAASSDPQSHTADQHPPDHVLTAPSRCSSAAGRTNPLAGKKPAPERRHLQVRESPPDPSILTSRTATSEARDAGDGKPALPGCRPDLDAVD